MRLTPDRGGRLSEGEQVPQPLQQQRKLGKRSLRSTPTESHPRRAAQNAAEEGER